MTRPKHGFDYFIVADPVSDEAIYAVPLEGEENLWRVLSCGDVTAPGVYRSLVVRCADWEAWDDLLGLEIIDLDPESGTNHMPLISPAHQILIEHTLP